MTKQRDEYVSKPDSVRRNNQAARIVEILRVHRMTGGQEASCDDVRKIAAEIDRCERTVYRHLKTLRMAYDAIGSSLLDG